MRQNNRDSILDAAVRVINRDGLTAITFDTVAREAGVTRGGMLYHFGSRDELILAINQYLADQWEANLLKTAGKPFEQTTIEERRRAYVGASLRASRAELLFLLEFQKDRTMSAPWARLIEAWSVPEPLASGDEAELVRFIARLAADGLWAYEYVSGRPMQPALRKQVSERLVQLLGTSG
ncbi:TetR family transcriptional regulator [Polyangium sorediatum]|uniref:TetR/AcrR family transcriptional regulator n=1 Tax=Polyangium sorediatum TaxID=889274 RepID=A0ABT6NUJ2_9BACT|nr:TetR/AcrR family transcriptional regulator [Polyangium sorediatum]MDI1432011.1 TetR/AcrR family transcriptional regulator [Polyangium sorediatum]